MTYGTPLAGALSAGNRAADAALPHQAITGEAAIAAALSRAEAHGAVIRINGRAHNVRDPVALVRAVATAARTGNQIARQVLFCASRTKGYRPFSVSAAQLRVITQWNDGQRHGTCRDREGAARETVMRRVLAMHRARVQKERTS